MRLSLGHALPSGQPPSMPPSDHSLRRSCTAHPADIPAARRRSPPEPMRPATHQPSRDLPGTLRRSASAPIMPPTARPAPPRFRGNAPRARVSFPAPFPDWKIFSIQATAVKTQGALHGRRPLGSDWIPTTAASRRTGESCPGKQEKISTARPATTSTCGTSRCQSGSPQPGAPFYRRTRPPGAAGRRVTLILPHQPRAYRTGATRVMTLRASEWRRRPAYSRARLPSAGRSYSG